MSPAWIRPRVNADGSRSFQVLFRRGGRGFRIEHAGSFRGWPSGRDNAGEARASLTTALADARRRRDLIAGWLAAGRNPAEELHMLLRPREVRDVGAWADAWLASRVDLAEHDDNHVYAVSVRRLKLSRLGRMDAHEATWTDVQEWISEQRNDRSGETLAPKTLSTYMSAVKQTFDYAGVEPNPARDRRVRLPVQDAEEVEPPSHAHVLAMLEFLQRKLRLPFAMIEQCGMRVSELGQYEWRDVDVDSRRIRVRSESAKGRRGRRRSRWVQVPEWLMEIVLDATPPDERQPGRKLFPDFSADVMRKAMERACQAARIPHYNPKSLRHRRISLWHGQGIPWRQIADRVGQSKPSITLDVYSHVMPLEEVPLDRYKQLVGDTR